jgi:oligopeptide transport system substrate-binding protein
MSLKIAFLVLVLAWLTASPQPSHAEFRFRILSDLGTLDWGYGEVNRNVIQQLMEGLTLSDLHGVAQPGIAESWRQLDPRTVEFKLRKTAKWSDGTAVCAQHFVDAWLRVLSPALSSPYAHYLFDIRGARAYHAGQNTQNTSVGVSTIGCHKLVVHLERPIGYFPTLVSHWVFSPIRLDLIKQHGSSWMLPNNLAVTGPYVLREWKKDRELVLARNESYYGAPAKEPTLRAIVVEDDSTALSLFEAGKIDWMSDIPLLARDGGLARSPAYKEFDSFVSYHLGFRHGAATELSREQRCALGLAIDKKLIPKILKGGETPTWNIVPKDLGASKRNDSFDPIRAKKLYGDAPKSFDLYFYSKNIHQPLMEFIQQQWKTHLNLNVNLVKMEPTSYWARLKNDPPAVFLSGTTAAYAHAFSFLSEFLSQSPANWGHYQSKLYDDTARTASELSPQIEPSRFKNLVAKAEDQILKRDCAIIPLYFRKSTALVNPKWRGFFTNAMTTTYLKNVYQNH